MCVWVVSGSYAEEVGRKLGSRVDILISRGNFAESVIFFLLTRHKNITDSAKFPLLIDLSTRDPNFLPTSSGSYVCLIVYSLSHNHSISVASVIAFHHT